MTLKGEVATRGEPAKFLRNDVVTFRGDECLFWPFNRGSSGYGQIKFNRKTFGVHRLVCEIVNGPPPTNKYQAAHSCGNGHLGCVNPRHLRWATVKENLADRYAHGTFPTGKNGGGGYNAKLNETNVREIRKLSGKVERKELASRFGVTASAIAAVQRRENWAWVA